MPHSSGGGSHSGGSHSSSHSSRSGSGSSSRRHIRRSYFRGARRYAYLHRGRTEYVYADYDITKKRSPLRFLLLIFYVPFLITFWIIGKDTLLPPQKLSADYDTRIIVADGLDILGDTEKLERSLENFYNETGITPAVFTVHNEDWQEYYDSLENYAYDLYVSTFPDEKHWLIVYSEPENPDEDFVDWYWEGMQGDDTSDILTSGKADGFNHRMQRYLTDPSKSVSEAISLSFDELSSNIMKVNIDWSMIVTLSLLVGFIVLHAYLMVFHDPNRKYRNAVECSEKAPVAIREEQCPYCGASYLSGTVTRCPNCQALLEISDNK